MIVHSVVVLLPFRQHPRNQIPQGSFIFQARSTYVCRRGRPLVLSPRWLLVAPVVWWREGEAFWRFPRANPTNSDQKPCGDTTSNGLYYDDRLSQQAFVRWSMLFCVLMFPPAAVRLSTAI